MTRLQKLILATMLILGAIVTGSCAWILVGVLDLQQNGVLITLGGIVGYGTACAASLYGLWQLFRARR